MTDIDLVDEESIDALLRASEAFGPLDSDALELVRNALEARVVRYGEVLMHQGDAADGLYLVGSGRLQVLIVREDGSEEIINEVGRGALVGEMALLTDSPRSATIRALRDSHLLFLSSAAFGRVVQANPQALRVIASALISKLMYTIRHGTTSTPATSIVIVPLDESEAVRELGDRLARSLESLMGEVPVVHVDDMAAELAQSSQLRRAAWREQIEGSHGAVVYVAEPTFSPWTDECVAHADLVVLAAAAGGTNRLRAVEEELERRRGAVARRSELVLLHAPHTVTPRGTRRWLGARRVDRHHHVRVDRTGDYDRVARLLVGRGSVSCSVVAAPGALRTSACYARCWNGA